MIAEGGVAVERWVNEKAVTTIAIQVSKVGEQEIEAVASHKVPLPQGQLLRLEGDLPVYGEIVAVTAAGGKSKQCDLRIRVIFGKPHLDLDEATLLDSTQLGGELQHMLGTVYSPLFLGETFMGDLVKLGPLSVVSGDSLESKQQALMEIVDGLQAEQRILVVDPLGLFTLAEGYTVHTAGADVRLSLQSFGVGRFMAHVQQELPPAFQPEAMGLMSDLIPLTLDFIPFKYLMSPSRLPDAPAKAALLHTLYAIYRNQVFADTPEQVFALDAVIPDQLNVLDLSGLHEPWRGIFYQFVCAELLRYKTHGLVPVLIYPENYLPNISESLQKLEECEYNTLVLPSQTGTECLASRANNQFFVERVLGDEHVQVHLKGEMTLGLRVTATLRGLEEDEHEIDLDDFETATRQAKPEALSFTPFPDFAPEEADAAAGEPMATLLAEPVKKKSNPPASVIKPAPKKATTPPSEPLPVPLSQPEQELEDHWDNDLPVEEEVIFGDGELPEDEAFLPEPEVLVDGEDDEEEEVELWQEDAVGQFEHLNPLAMPPLEIGEVDDRGDANEDDEDDFDFDFDSPQGMMADLESTPDANLPGALSAPDYPPHPAVSMAGEDDFDDDFDFDMPTGLEAGIEAVGSLQTVADDEAPDFMEPMPPEPEKYQNPTAPHLDTIPVIPKAVDEEFVTVPMAIPFAEGDRVKHPKYGYGMVEKVIPTGERTTVKVMFELVGKRLLDAETAQLTKE